MQKLISILLFCYCYTLLGQETSIQLEKEKQDELNQEFKNSQLTNEAYKQLMYEKAASEKNILDAKKKILIQEQQMQLQQRALQQKSIIGDDKENQQKIHVTTIQESLSYDSKEDTSKMGSSTANPQKTDDDDNRLFGPSQYDSRIEPLNLDPSISWQNQILEVSNSVGMIVERDRITQYAKEVYQIDDQQTLGKRYNLCPQEAFYSQPVVGVGTAWLYDTNRMITASHVFEQSIENYVVIFGYQILNSKGLIDIFIPKSRIYDIQKIIQKDLDLDLVAFELDRSALGVPLQWENPPQNIGDKTEIYMIGYPTGLPLKIAVNASIKENNHPNYFYTSLDSFQGNSGSPVFNFYTHKVIGVLVSGEIDYKFNGNCNESPLCKYPYCKGEKVVKLNSFLLE